MENNQIIISVDPQKRRPEVVGDSQIDHHCADHERVRECSVKERVSLTGQ